MPKYLISKIIVKNIGVWTLISGPQLHVVLPSKFITDLVKDRVLSTTNDYK
jgi:hypothetical protein